MTSSNTLDQSESETGGTGDPVQDHRDERDDDLVDGELHSYVDDDEPVRPPRRERIVTKVSLVLAAAVIGVGGMALGAHFKKTVVTTATAGAGGSGASASGTGATGFSGAGTGTGGNGGFAGGAGAGGGGGATVGTVKLVDGNNVYIADASGTVVKVSTSPATVINVSAPGTVGQLMVGENVIVRGQAGADGTVAATTVNAGPGFTAGRGGGGGSGTAVGGAGSAAAGDGAANSTAPRQAG